MASRSQGKSSPDTREHGLEDVSKTSVERESNLSLQYARTPLEPPESVRRLTTDERAKLERRLVQKMDLRILPMIVIMYVLNYLDRNSIASARVQGLQTDLGLSDVQYQVCLLSNVR